MIPLTDLEPQHRQLRDELLGAVASVLDEQQFILGRRVSEFEERLAELLGAEAAVGVSSGTDALLLALLAEGIGPGDEVITTALSFVATAEVIARVGARPVFVDVDPTTLCLDAAQVEAAISPRTRALLPVHLFGCPADMTALSGLCERHGLALIEDAAQALGAQHEGSFVGTLGDYGALSFFPAKILGGAGDGGMVLCPAHRAEKLRALRLHGSRDKRNFEVIGGNFRLDALQAAILAVKLPHLTGWLAERRRAATDYRRFFTALGTAELRLPTAAPGHAYNHFVVQSERRDALSAFLRDRGIQSAAYYTTPLHLQPCFAELGYRPGSLPETEQAGRSLLALPLYPELSTAHIETVARAVDEFMRTA